MATRGAVRRGGQAGRGGAGRERGGAVPGHEVLVFDFQKNPDNCQGLLFERMNKGNNYYLDRLGVHDEWLKTG